MTMTPEEANIEIGKINGNSDHPYWKQEHEEHDQAVQYMAELMRMAHPEDQR